MTRPILYYLRPTDLVRSLVHVEPVLQVEAEVVAEERTHCHRVVHDALACEEDADDQDRPRTIETARE